MRFQVPTTTCVFSATASQLISRINTVISSHDSIKQALVRDCIKCSPACWLLCCRPCRNSIAWRRHGDYVGNEWLVLIREHRTTRLFGALCNTVPAAERAVITPGGTRGLYAMDLVAQDLYLEFDFKCGIQGLHPYWKYSPGGHKSKEKTGN